MSVEMNEYLEAFDELQSKHTFKGEQWFGERQRLVEKYSWAVPNRKAIQYLSAFDKIVEVGAGTGYWAKCINDDGGNVVPYDIEGCDDWTYVEEKKVTKMPEECFDNPILMVWPPRDEYLPSGFVLKKSPNHVLYVGEPAGGCTADRRFFQLIEEDYGLVGKIDIPSYTGVNDNLFHYVLKR